MTVLQLMKLLFALVPEHGNELVVLAHDEEGNGYAPLAEGFSFGKYRNERGFSWGEIHDDGDGVDAIVFWPGA